MRIKTFTVTNKPAEAKPKTLSWKQMIRHEGVYTAWTREDDSTRFIVLRDTDEISTVLYFHLAKEDGEPYGSLEKADNCWSRDSYRYVKVNETIAVTLFKN